METVIKTACKGIQFFWNLCNTNYPTLNSLGTTMYKGIEASVGGH